MANKRITSIAVEVLSQSELGLRVYDGAVDCWLPKSQIDFDEPDKAGCTIVDMPEWLAREKGLI